jgi:hypothetical protein
MVTTAPEMAVEKPQVRLPNESKAGTDGRMRPTSTEKNGSGELTSSARRGKRRRNTRGSESPSSVERFFLLKDGSDGIPELDHEVEDENTAMVEALKTGRNFIILAEWRPTVDNSTKGRPVVTKEPVSKGK